MPALPPEMVPALVAGFAMVCVLVSLVLRFRDGWSALERHYLSEGTQPDSMQTEAWGQVGSMGASQVLDVGGDERGLYLAPALLLGGSRAPLRIPWSELHERNRGRGPFFMKLDTFRVGPQRIRVKLQASVLEAYSAYLPPTHCQMCSTLALTPGAVQAQRVLRCFGCARSFQG
ncbi:hypothetical protein [Myxococcus eversor]|uniref:hypothetical protein n=1 Tax=Myxococcus eversor TaxID=2709661 RepID=UPI0013D843CD|nr:hypothetical protein [Myxococcus eversor]